MKTDNKYIDQLLGFFTFHSGGQTDTVRFLLCYRDSFYVASADPTDMLILRNWKKTRTCGGSTIHTIVGLINRAVCLGEKFNVREDAEKRLYGY